MDRLWTICWVWATQKPKEASGLLTVGLEAPWHPELRKSLAGVGLTVSMTKWGNKRPERIRAVITGTPLDLWNCLEGYVVPASALCTETIQSFHAPQVLDSEAAEITRLKVSGDLAALSGCRIALWLAFKDHVLPAEQALSQAPLLRRNRRATIFHHAGPCP